MMKIKKTKIKFDIERHREVKLIREAGRSLRELESDGFVIHRTNPISGAVEWRITDAGFVKACNLFSIASTQIN